LSNIPVLYSLFLSDFIQTYTTTTTTTTTNTITATITTSVDSGLHGVICQGIRLFSVNIFRFYMMLIRFNLMGLITVTRPLLWKKLAFSVSSAPSGTNRHSERPVERALPLVTLTDVIEVSGHVHFVTTKRM
jgi:hypothetical protein